MNNPSPTASDFNPANRQKVLRAYYLDIREENLWHYYQAQAERMRREGKLPPLKTETTKPK